MIFGRQGAVPLTDGDWRNTVVQVLTQGKESGMSATALVRLTQEHLGDAFNSVTFMNSFRKAFGVPYGQMRRAALWRGIHPGPHAISDDEFIRLLAPWV